MRIPPLQIERLILTFFLSLLLHAPLMAWAQAAAPRNQPSAPNMTDRSRTYLGFDRNEYPGDDQLAELRRQLCLCGILAQYAPGQLAKFLAGQARTPDRAWLWISNSLQWAPRCRTSRQGCGRARPGGCRERGLRRESRGFSAGAILFLDQEEGGRLLPEQSAYVMAWVEGIRGSRYRPGVYCSGIPVREGGAGAAIRSARPRTFSTTRVAGHSRSGWQMTRVLPLPAASFPQRFPHRSRAASPAHWCGNIPSRLVAPSPRSARLPTPRMAIAMPRAWNRTRRVFSI